MSEIVIRTKDLRREFPLPRRKLLCAVDNVTFAVSRSEILGVLGPNGAGKTTLLRMLAGIIPPSSGTARVCGFDCTTQAEELRRHVGYLSAQTRLYERLHPREILRYFGRLFDLSKKEIENRITLFAELLDLKDILDRRCESLSTGQAQKVNLARALLHDPELLLLDEPTSGLDLVASHAVWKLLQERRRDGYTILLSTHSISDAEHLCDRILLLYHGAVIALGTREQLRQRFRLESLADIYAAATSGEPV